MSNPVVVDRVEGLSRIKEKKEFILFRLDSVIKKGVNVNDMLRALKASEKTFLRGVNKLGNRWHDTTCHTGSEDPVIRIGNTKGTSVGNKTGELFREEEKETVVEAFRREVALEDGAKNLPENTSGEVGGGTPSSKRDTIRAGGGVVRVLNGANNIVQRGSS